MDIFSNFKLICLSCYFAPNLLFGGTVDIHINNLLLDCSCSNFINRNGFGQCKKGDRGFHGAVTCYVKNPSTCTDKIQSTTNKEHWRSAQACKKVDGNGKFYCSTIYIYVRTN